MQLLSPLTRDAQVGRAGEAGRPAPALCAPRRRPYDRDPRRPADADRSICAACCSRPPTRDEINYRKRLRDAMLQAIGSSRFALYHHIIRRRIDVALDAELSPTPSRASSTQRWRGAARGQAALRQRAVPDPDPAPAAGPGRRLRPARARCSAAAATEADAGAAYEARQLDVARDALLAALGSYAPRLLGVYETPAGALLGAARIPLRALQWRDAPGAAAACRISAPICPIGGSASARRRSSSGPPGRLARSFVGHGLDQGLSRPDRARHARRAAPPAVRADRLAELRLRRPAGGAVADEPGAAPDALGRGRGGQPARRSRPAPRTRSPPAAPASASIT